MDQGCTGEAPAEAAKEAGITLEVVKLPEAKKGFGLLPRRWVLERSFAWATRFHRLAKDYERLPETPETLAGLHFVVFAILMLAKAPKLLQSAYHALDALGYGADDQHDADQGDGRRTGDGEAAEQPFPGGEALEPMACGHDHQADDNEHGGQADAEGGDQGHPKGDPVQRDGGEQHDKGGGARDDSARNAQGQQGARRDRPFGDAVMVVMAEAVRMPPIGIMRAAVIMAMAVRVAVIRRVQVDLVRAVRVIMRVTVVVRMGVVMVVRMTAAVSDAA